MKLFGRHTATLLSCGDIVVFAISLFLTLVVRYGKMPHTEIIQAHIMPFAALFIVWMLVFFIAGFYDRSMELARKQIPMRVLRVQAINILLAALAFFAIPFGIEPKTNLVIYLVISTFGIVAWRLFIFPRVVRGERTKILVVGSGSEARDIVDALKSNPYYRNMHVFHAVDFDISKKEYVSTAGGKQVRTFDIVAVNLGDVGASSLPVLYRIVFEQGARFLDLHELYEQLTHRIPSSLITEAWFLRYVSLGYEMRMYDVVKRISDIVLAIIISIPSIIIFPFVALAIKIQDGGKVFYVSHRIGMRNEPFLMYKFRTMTGTDSKDTVNSTLSNTKVGTFLRKTRLDELPQLLNVLKGDLSFIGPRPETPARAKIYEDEIPFYSLRHMVRPGLSGWAQIHDYEVPRTAVDVNQTVRKLSYDIYYLKNHSLVLDLEIALKTIGTLISRSGT